MYLHQGATESRHKVFFLLVLAATCSAAACVGFNRSFRASLGIATSTLLLVLRELRIISRYWLLSIIAMCLGHPFRHAVTHSFLFSSFDSSYSCQKPCIALTFCFSRLDVFLLFLIIFYCLQTFFNKMCSLNATIIITEQPFNSVFPNQFPLNFGPKNSLSELVLFQPSCHRANTTTPTNQLHICTFTRSFKTRELKLSLPLTDGCWRDDQSKAASLGT